MLLAPCSAKLSAQSPPCSRNASPAATRASDFLRLRASPAKTSGGKVASCFSVSSNAARSGYSGTCRIGFLRQPSGVQRSAIATSSLTPPHGEERGEAARLEPLAKHVDVATSAALVLRDALAARALLRMRAGRVHQRAEALIHEAAVATPACRLCGQTAYSAAASPNWAVGVRMVTSSSAAVGCSAMVASKSALVAPIFMATAT